MAISANMSLSKQLITVVSPNPRERGQTLLAFSLLPFPKPLPLIPTPHPLHIVHRRSPLPFPCHCPPCLALVLSGEALPLTGRPQRHPLDERRHDDGHAGGPKDREFLINQDREKRLSAMYHDLCCCRLQLPYQDNCYGKEEAAESAREHIRRSLSVNVGHAAANRVKCWAIAEVAGDEVEPHWDAVFPHLVPLPAADGTFIKTTLYNGTFLVANHLDGNNIIWPLARALVCSEDGNN
ncbi:hypothetical protein BDK51DRAFT_43671 [Blyttiomyces helicus]|uniref:Uncharacterized protein n=1 Tax=Blyttiomyces helicus TaxID=388810 RepID=A0A4P9WIY6_9FUNG|nr:hypothetical protein BDK51DRAFT_43671 [Blyttiomyces helicus]|eukprot:RKO92322.1 hypothetical protein BDK51DRAFT_43671 [Blyttiomyces helicus]